MKTKVIVSALICAFFYSCSESDLGLSDSNIEMETIYEQTNLYESKSELSEKFEKYNKLIEKMKLNEK
jgi:hypothetical protein